MEVAPRVPAGGGQYSGKGSLHSYLSITEHNVGEDTNNNKVAGEGSLIVVGALLVDQALC